MEIKFNEVDVAKLNLTRDDVLVVTAKGEKEKMAGLDLLADLLQETFSKNKVVVVGLAKNDEIQFTTIREKQLSYCSDCNCGKRQEAENDLS